MAGAYWTNTLVVFESEVKLPLSSQNSCVACCSPDPPVETALRPLCTVRHVMSLRRPRMHRIGLMHFVRLTHPPLCRPAPVSEPLPVPRAAADGGPGVLRPRHAGLAEHLPQSLGGLVAFRFMGPSPLHVPHCGLKITNGHRLPQSRRPLWCRCFGPRDGLSGCPSAMRPSRSCSG